MRVPGQPPHFVMPSGRLQLLQVYASWLADRRTSQVIDMTSVTPILSRLPDNSAISDSTEVFIDARREDALFALSFLQMRIFIEEVWVILFEYIKGFERWRTIGSKEGLLESLLAALLIKTPNDNVDSCVLLIMEHLKNMNDNSDSLVFIQVAFKVLCDLSSDVQVKPKLTRVVLSFVESDMSILHSAKTWKVFQLVLRSLHVETDPNEAFRLSLKLAEDLLTIIRVKNDPPSALLDLFAQIVSYGHRVWKHVEKDTVSLDFLSETCLKMSKFASATVFGSVLSPLIDLISSSFNSELSLFLLHKLRPIIDELASKNLTISPEFEHTAHLYGILMGRLIVNCLDDEKPKVIAFIKDLRVSIPEHPKPSDTVTGGFHLTCPTALPIFGAVCEIVKDGDLAAHCFAIVAQCFEKGPFGQRSRIFYDQMIAIAANTAGVTHLNATLDILCRIYLETEGLDANSAALSTAFEDLVSACSKDRVKCELVTLSLLGLIVQKGVKLAEKKSSHSTATFLPQPPTALLELLLPAVASGLSELEKVESISRQAFVELVQEFWFVAIFHAYQAFLKWPDSWMKHLTKIAVHSPILIKERERAEGNTAKLLLSQPIPIEFRSHLASLMSNCSSRVGELGTAQCLWLLAFHQCESMRVISTDKFDSVVQYITDDIVADLQLSDFVNDLSIGIVKGWLDKTGRRSPHLLIDLTVSMVDLLGSIYDRIHDAGISLLRFILSQDEQLMGEEAIWRVLFKRLCLLSALKCHEPGSMLSHEIKDASTKEYITDSGYAQKVFEDVLAFFRSVANAAARLSPDHWHEWVLEMTRELNDPVAGADVDYLHDDLLRSLLLDRQQPKRSMEGPSLDGARQLTHHMDWAMSLCMQDLSTMALQDTEKIQESIIRSLGDMKNCLKLTDEWSSIIRKYPSRLYPIIAELGKILTCTLKTPKRTFPEDVFMGKVTMGPSTEEPIDQLPVRPLCLCNIVSFLGIQLGRQTFSQPSFIGIFTLIGEVLLEVGLSWPIEHGRRLVVSSIAEYAFKVFLQLQRIYPDSPSTSLFKTRLFLFLQAYFEQSMDWHIESQRVLQREIDILGNIILLLKKSTYNKMPKRHYDVNNLFSTLLRHDLLRVSALLGRKPNVDDLGLSTDFSKLLAIASSISVPLAIQYDQRLGKHTPGEQSMYLKEQLSKSLLKNPWLMFTESFNTPTVIETILNSSVDPGDGMVGRAVFPPGFLHFLPPCPPLSALAIFRSSVYEQSPRWLNYAMRSLESFPPELLFFYTPQITQAVRRDHLGYIGATILHIARSSSELAHQIIWNMLANMYIDDLGTVPDPMKARLEELVEKIVAELSNVPFYKREFAFFERVTGISGSLKTHIKKEKWEKKKKIDEELRKIPVDAGVYLPSNPESTVIDIDYDSGRPLQSQAKAPFMATFRVRDNTADGKEIWQSAIFKVGDDCRQDVLALQFIAAIKMIFESNGLNAYLFPYRVIATAPGCGVIEVIPNSQSRDQLGREKINSLYGYFTFKFGGDRTVRFGAARDALVRSMAAYSTVCYLLAIRDRHNGNIMVDEQGHLIHIDFGFILDIAPGGIRFESAPFKFTSEMLQVLGGRESAAFAWFQELCVQCFLTVRPHCGLLSRLIEQMVESGLPCFVHNPEKAIRNLKSRLRPDLNEWEARQHMEDLVSQSCENVSTVLYDSYQHNRNGIPY